VKVKLKIFYQNNIRRKRKERKREIEEEGS
jgi:hypothetical protein